MSCLLFVTAVLFSVAPTAQSGGPTITTLVIEGQQVEGVGAVTRIDNLAVNNNGEWIVEVDTDHSDTEADGALLKDGALFIREGDPLAMPVGAAVGSFDTVNINLAGNHFWNLFLDNAPIGEDSGIFFGTDLVIQEGEISTASGFSSNTPYLGFFEVKFSDSSNNAALMLATVDDVNIASTVDQAFVALTYNPNTQAFTETVVLKEGDVPNGMSDPLVDFETNPHTMSLSANAEHYMFVLDTSAGTAVDTAVYKDGTVLAREGDASPAGGIPWLDFGTNTRVSVNNTGGYALLGRINSGNTANDTVIVRNGEVLIREGDSPPGIGGNFAITSFGTGPVLIVDAADYVIWFADWDDPNTDIDSALFINDQVLIREGITSVDGRVVDTIASVQDAFGASPDGRYVIVEVTFDSGQDAALLVEIPAASEFATLTDLNVVTGTILDGGLGNLDQSDDSYLHTRSGFGQTLVDLHNLTMDVSATTSIVSPTSMSIDVESSIDYTTGTARVLLYDWNAGTFDQIDSFPVDSTERTRHVSVSNPADYVNGNGQIIVRVRHFVFVPQFAFLFQSWFDLLRIELVK